MTGPLKIHPSITPERLTEALQRYNEVLDNPGFCIRCGEEAEGVEPDATAYECDACGERGVYGAEELMLMTF